MEQTNVLVKEVEITETKYSNSTNGGFDVGFLSITWTAQNGGLSIDVRVGFKGLSHDMSTFISIHSPAVKIQTPNILGTYVEVELKYDDNAGSLTAKGTAHFWLFGNREESVAISTEILPPYIIGLLAIGGQFPGILKFAPDIINAGLNFNVASDIRKVFEEVSEKAGISSSNIYDIFRSLPDFGKNLARSIPSDRGICEEIKSISATSLEAGLYAVVNDSRIKAIYPGIDEKLIFSEDARNEAQASLSSIIEDDYKLAEFSDLNNKEKILKTIQAVLIATGVVTGLTVAALAVLAGFFAAIAAATALSGGTIFAIALALTITAVIAAVVVATIGITVVVIALIFELILIWTGDTANAVSLIDQNNSLSLGFS
ncbi:MAG: hypothetical protein ABUK01_15855 [Leptospirales bacterium]